MTYVISDIKVSLNEAEEEQFRKEGFLQNPVNLNKGNSGNKVYFWYKSDFGTPITRIQFSINEDRTDTLYRAGYIKVDKDLNAGTGGDTIYLWYYRGSSEYDIPIVDLFVSTDRENEAQLFQYDWERLACNLNRKAGGTRMYLWVRREKIGYVCDITATSDFQGDDNLLKGGYVRVDENTNRAAGGSRVFIWYRQTTDSKKAVREIVVSGPGNKGTTGYIKLDQDLNQGTTGIPLHLYYTRDDLISPKPIRTISLIVKKTGLKAYEIAGVRVIGTDLNSGNDGDALFLCFYK
ncbi:uncharacterized protein ACNS7B_013608 [Menidia menidia]